MTSRCKTLLILALVLGVADPVMGQDAPAAAPKPETAAPQKEASSPAPAEKPKKAKKKKAKKSAEKKEKAVEAPKSGEPAQPMRVSGKDPYSVYSTGLFQEVYIDDNLNLYKTRQYGGIVPALEEKKGTNMAVPTAQPGDKLLIDRIGFEQRELFSRLFVLGNGSLSPWIYDNFAQAQGNPDVAYQIFVELPGAQIPKYNDRRPLITRAFNTPVASIEGQPIKGGVRVVVTLKKEARYLPVQVGRLLYIDVER